MRPKVKLLSNVRIVEVNILIASYAYLLIKRKMFSNSIQKLVITIFRTINN